MLDSIYRAYSLIEGWFESPGKKIGYAGPESWSRMRELNDYAYYVLIFEQLENYVNEEFLYKRDQDFEIQRRYSGQLDFMVKVDVVFDGNRKICGLVDVYYDVRCAIAHGDVTEGLFAKFGSSLREPITIERLHADVAAMMKY